MEMHAKGALNDFTRPEGKKGGKLFQWPDPATQRLRELIEAGNIYDECAEMLNLEFGANLTRKAIANRANFIGLKSCNWNKWPAEHDDELKALFSAGYSASIIAEKLNAKFGSSHSRNSIIGRCNRMGMSRSGHQPEMSKSRGGPRAPRRPRPATPHQSFYIVARAPRIPVEVVRLRCAEIEPRHLDLLELERRDCRWPYGDGPVTFCGHPKRDGSSYCQAHHQLSVGVGTPSERAARKIAGWVR